MPKKSAKVTPTSSKIKVIYNPNAGQKRRQISFGNQTSLEDIKSLLEQYQLVADFSPTKSPGHATQLAAEAAKEGYQMVIAAGGDGTISEVANGLINTDVTLGILPLGTYMNTARMLSIPMELSSAVQIIKIGRVRKIDVGLITSFDGKRLPEKVYFLESAGLGIEAEFQRHFLEFEHGNYKALWSILKLARLFVGDLATITIDDKQQIRTRATLVTVSNGPFTGAAIPVAPDAKLNDHRLTVSLYRMSKAQIIRYFWKNSKVLPHKPRQIEVHQAQKVRIETKVPKLVHADARVFGHTPVEFEVVPSALSIISGFPKPGESALLKRTLLDP